MPRVLNIVEDNDSRTSCKSENNAEKSHKQKNSTIEDLKEIVEEEKEEEDINTFTDELSKRDIYNSLPCMQSSLFATVLEDTVTELRILVECNNELRIKQAQSNWHNLKRIKYGVKEPVVENELEEIDPKRLDCDEYKIKKLDTDRQFITEVVTSTYMELCMRKSFKVLQDRIDAIISVDKYRETLAEEEAKNKVIRRDLYRQLRQRRNHYKTVLYDTEVRIDNLRTEVEDYVLLSETKNRYIDNWQNSRIEQHVLNIQNAEGAHSNSIESYKQRIDQELRVHTEIVMLMDIQINGTLQGIEDWMDKYDEDMEKIDIKIHIKKNAYQDMVSKRIYLEETIEKHEKEVKDWVAFKDQRAKAIEYRDTMTKSAIIVQAWWRGLLVRLQMGPYRVARRAKVKLAGAAAAAMIKKRGK